MLFLLANDFGLSLYKQLQGDFGARGYAPGAVTLQALLHIVVANLLMALAPWRELKIGVVVLASGSLAWHLLPSHPLRALFYCGLLLTLSLGMMMATWGKQWQKSRPPV